MANSLFGVQVFQSTGGGDPTKPALPMVIKTLGVKISDNLLSLADEVIE